MRVLHLIPSLQHSGASRQLTLLARGFDSEHFRIEVCQLGPESANSEPLRQAGITVHSLDWQRNFDPIRLWRLRKILHQFDPDLIHAWHRSTLRWIALLGRRYLSRVVLSQPFSWEQGCRLPGLDRWLLRKVARVVVQGDAEAQLGQQQGLFLEKIAVIPPGIAAAPRHPSTDGRRSPRKLVCIGPLAGHKGYRDALWAFDIVRHVFTDLQLTFLGEGPERSTLERFGRVLECGDRIHFAGHVAQVDRYLEEADICWIPSRKGGGTQAALEAMSAGLPVVACQVPNLHGLIVDGQSGFLVPPGDKVNLARRTRDLLLDPKLAARIGAQARERAQNHFAARQLVQRCQRMYMEVAA